MITPELNTLLQPARSGVSEPQQTLARSFTFAGVGIHTGTQAKVTVHPADVDTGRLLRVGGRTFPARADYVVDTTRCTTLAYEGARVHTTEHLLSALYAYGIDNALIEVEGQEVPILDGSALPHTQAIEQSGIIAQGKPARVLTLEQEITVQDRATELTASPANVFAVRCRVEFSFWPEGSATQNFSASSPVETGETNLAGGQAYHSHIAPARTFAFQQELEQLLAAGLALGGSLDNALIISPPDTFSSPLRLPNEWCAHKLLDVMGDLALVNARLRVAVNALRPGHTANVMLAQALLSQARPFED